MYARFFRSSPAGVPAQATEEVRMSWSKWIRKFHRVMAMTFTIVVAAIFITLGLGKEPVLWVYYVPLFPLALLLLSGLYLFALPYAAKRRSAQSAIGQE
jgi:hypothetical protein